MRYYEFIVEYKTEITKNRFGDAILKKLDIPHLIDTDGQDGHISDYQLLAARSMGFYEREYENNMTGFWGNISKENVYDKKTDRIIDGILSTFETFDPTPNKQYVPYLLNWYVNSNTIHSGRGSFPELEDAQSTLKQALFQFYKMRERIPERYRDIGQFTSATDFMNSVQALQDQYGKKEILEKGRSQMIYDSKWATIYWPEDEEASCYLGQGTQWCTASTQSDNYFDHYNETGPLLILNFKFDLLLPNDRYSSIDDEDSYDEKRIRKIQADMQVDPDDTGALFWNWDTIADPQDKEIDFSNLWDNNTKFQRMWNDGGFQKSMDKVARQWWEDTGIVLHDQKSEDEANFPEDPDGHFGY